MDQRNHLGLVGADIVTYTNEIDSYPRSIPMTGTIAAPNPDKTTLIGTGTNFIPFYKITNPISEELKPGDFIFDKVNGEARKVLFVIEDAQIIKIDTPFTNDPAGLNLVKISARGINQFTLLNTGGTSISYEAQDGQGGYTIKTIVVGGNYFWKEVAPFYPVVIDTTGGGSAEITNAEVRVAGSGGGGGSGSSGVSFEFLTSTVGTVYRSIIDGVTTWYDNTGAVIAAPAPGDFKDKNVGI